MSGHYRLNYPLCNIKTDQAGTIEFSVSMGPQTWVSRTGLSIENIEHFIEDIQNELSNFKSAMELRNSEETHQPAPSAIKEIEK